MPSEYRFSEGESLEELAAYINRTYGSHYGDKVQANDLIISAGQGEGFFLGNVIKYASRYGKKNGKNRDDLLKVLHYAILALHVHNMSEGNK